MAAPAAASPTREQPQCPEPTAEQERSKYKSSKQHKVPKEITFVPETPKQEFTESDEDPGIFRGQCISNLDVFFEVQVFELKCADSRFLIF